MRRLALVVVMMGLAGVAGAAEGDLDKQCKALQQRAIDLIQTGHSERVKPLAPELEKCRRRAEAQLAIEAQKIVDQANAKAAPRAN